MFGTRTTGVKKVEDLGGLLSQLITPGLSGKMVPGDFMLMSTDKSGNDGIWGPFDTIIEAKDSLRMLCSNSSITSAVIVDRKSVKNG